MIKIQTIKESLGLENFKYVYIQKVIGLSINLFIISIDSRHLNTPISFARLRELKSNQLLRVITDFKIKALHLTAPVDIDSYIGIIPHGSVILFRDIASEVFIDDNSYLKVSL